jgi:hypothetical protein
MNEEKKLTHKVKIDNNITMLLDIKENIDILELKGLMMKINQFFKMSNIQEDLGLSTNISKPIYSGKKRGRKTDEEKKRIIEEYEQMHNSTMKKEMAEKYGYSYGVLQRMINVYRKQLNLKPNDKRENNKRAGRYSIWTDEEINTIKRLHKKGYRAKKLKKVLKKKTTGQIKNKIKYMKGKGEL